MKFDRALHQKVRYQGELYAIVLEEFPNYREGDRNYKVVLHPMGNEWIVHITNPTMRDLMTIRKGDLSEVLPQTAS